MLFINVNTKLSYWELVKQKKIFSFTIKQYFNVFPIQMTNFYGTEKRP